MIKHLEFRKGFPVLFIVLFFNLAIISIAFVYFSHTPSIMSTALLAYVFGLRHAVDADHIAAIDNATRKLMNEGRSALSSGMYFSLGHASVVFIACLIFAYTTRPVQEMFPQVKEVGATLSMFVSGLFLMILAYLNTRSLYVSYQKRKFIQNNLSLRIYSNTLDEKSGLGDNHGLMTLFFAPLFKMISKSRHMFGIGFLFGIGFDTATEVAIFGMAAAQASHGETIINIMIMPLLFTAGMLLIDSLDGLMMVNLYKWAQIDPLRKTNYNIAISSLSIVVAAVVGFYEVIKVFSQDQIITPRISGAMDDVIAESGFVLIGTSVCVWLIFYSLHKIKVKKITKGLT